MNLVRAMELAKVKKAKISAITGRDGGEARKLAEVLILIPSIHPARITPHTESFQALIWHLLVSHPSLQSAETKW